jgi:CHAD domain-containing protein
VSVDGPRDATTKTAASRRTAREGGAKRNDKRPRRARQGDEQLQKLTDALKESLGKCAHDPDVDAVHDTRTGTRRIEAALEADLRNAGANGGGGQDELTKAVRGWERLLKTVRRAAAPVRDLDVQRKLLKTLAPVVEAETKTPVDESEHRMAGQIGRLDVDKLDGALKAERESHAAALRKNAAKWAGKLDGHFEAFTAARHLAGRRGRWDAAQRALDAFARLAYQMRQLDAENLHDFRKGAKKARYMAEQGGERAEMVGKALKKLQDEIGDWHDWLMLDEEAHKHLDKDGAKLTAEIERMRDIHFAMAMKMEAKLRGRLLGEGLAVQAKASYAGTRKPRAPGTPGSRGTPVDRDFASSDTRFAQNRPRNPKKA